MKTWQRVLIVLTGSLLACGPSRINKLPIPRERVLKAYRLMAEADRMLKEGKDHLAILKYIEATRLNPYHEMIFGAYVVGAGTGSETGIRSATVYCRIGRYPQACGHTIQDSNRTTLLPTTLGLWRCRPGKAKESLSTPTGLICTSIWATVSSCRDDTTARQAYQEALALDPEVFERKTGTRLTFPDPITFDVDLNYDMARLFAEFGDRDSCLQYLDKALEAGFSDQKRLAEEPAFDQLRQSKDFIDPGRYGLSLK